MAMERADVISILNPSKSFDRSVGAVIKKYAVKAEPSTLSMTWKALTRPLRRSYKSIGEDEDYVYPGL